MYRTHPKIATCVGNGFRTRRLHFGKVVCNPTTPYPHATILLGGSTQIRTEIAWIKSPVGYRSLILPHVPEKDRSKFYTMRHDPYIAGIEPALTKKYLTTTHLAYSIFKSRDRESNPEQQVSKTRLISIPHGGSGMDGNRTRFRLVRQTSASPFGHHTIFISKSP